MSKAIVQSSVAERGPASAQFNLGVAYINGQGVEIKSNEMAREWWKKRQHKETKGDENANLKIVKDWIQLLFWYRGFDAVVDVML